MILEALARLLPRPVHEETDMAVNHANRTEHDEYDCCRREAREKTDDETQTAEELADADQITQRPQHLDDGGEAGAAECAEKFLRAVRHEDDAHKDAGREERPINRRTITNRNLSCHNFLPAER